MELHQVAQLADDLDRAVAFHTDVVDTKPHLIHTDTDGSFGEIGWEEWMAFLRDSEGSLVGLASRHAPAS